jgi:hypothetical protein
MESARFQLSEKATLVPAVDGYLRSLSSAAQATQPAQLP